MSSNLRADDAKKRLSSLLNHFGRQHSSFVDHPLLQRAGIEVLSGPVANRECVAQFYARYVFPYRQRVALCGINPGRLGAGLSGVPFVDLSWLSELLEGDFGENTERSARFFRKMVLAFGAGDFFGSVYVTNLSTCGFVKKQKNINYDNLPAAVQEKIFEAFSKEMSLLGISEVVPCSKLVRDTLLMLRARGDIRMVVHASLPHPNWCAFPQHVEKALERYSLMFQPFIDCATSAHDHCI